jgi:hypothetical protein
MPFFLIICIFLLWVFSGFRLPFSRSPSEPITTTCAPSERLYTVERSDTCWEIAQRYDVELDNLVRRVDCDALMPGATLCLPPSLSRT